MSLRFRIGVHLIKPVIALVVIYWLSGCAGYNHHKIRTEQERQLQEQRESAALIDSQMPAEERKVMDEVAAADERRQQAAMESRKRQDRKSVV